MDVNAAVLLKLRNHEILFTMDLHLEFDMARVLDLLSLIFVCLVSISFVGCKTERTSKTSGHYENTTAEEMEKFAGQQMAVPETIPGQNVLIHHLILDFDGSQFLQVLLSTGAEVFVAMPPESDPQYTIYRQKFESIAAAQKGKLVFVPSTLSGHQTVWARDWAPISAFAKNGEPRLLDFNYYPEREIDDSFPQRIAKIAQLTRVNIPVYLEGGNFMISEQGECVVSEKIKEANIMPQFDNDVPINEAIVVELLKKFAGCKSVNVLGTYIGEPTGHVDMWAKFLKGRKVLVNEIRQDALKLVSNKDDFLMLTDYQKFLNSRAEDFKKLGFDVIRIPSPIPAEREAYFPSYSNLLLLGKTAIVPRYTKKLRYSKDTDTYSEEPFFGKELLPAYEKIVSEILTAEGYNVSFVDSDKLIERGGSIHCSAMQVAFGSKKQTTPGAATQSSSVAHTHNPAASNFPKWCKVNSPTDHKASVRTGAGSRFEKILELNDGASIKALSETVGWYSVEFKLGGLDYGAKSNKPAFIAKGLLQCQ